jgi:YfaZ precursor
MLKKIALIAASAASAFAMHSGEININESDLEVSAKFDVGQFNQNVEPNTMFIGGKFLNADNQHSSHRNANIDPYFEANFKMQKEVGNAGMTIGMGVKLNYTKDYSTLPLGLEFAYKIPATDFVPMYLHGSLYYAPSALAFSDASDYLEYRIGYDVEVIDNGRITLGYRHMDTNYDGYDFTYNKSWYVGFKIGF